MSSISIIYKAIDHNVDNEISNTTFDEDEKLKSSIYRHLYRLQVYLLEPFFSGYLLSLILSNGILNNHGIETSTFQTCNLGAATIVGLIQSVLYSTFIESPLPTKSVLSSTNRVNMITLTLGLRLSLVIDAA